MSFFGAGVNEVSGLEKHLPHENVAAAKEEVVPQSGVKSYPGKSILEKTLIAKKFHPQRGVTFVRDFPPFCGRNALLLSEKERVKWLTSLKNKGFNLEKFDVNALEGSASRLSAEENQSEPEELATQKIRNQGAYEAYSRNDMKEDVEYMSENNIKSHSGTFPIEFDCKSKKVTKIRDGYIRVMEENPIRDIVIYE
ncbi:hypothetical protein REPUB_Repub07fG0224500 [Reevesia pubescens]